MNQLLILLVLIITLTGCTPGDNNHEKNMETPTQEALACKLTSQELQQRKATIIASLKSRIVEKKELENGFSYRFEGSDIVLDELTTFVKTERLCCGFFDFGIAIKGDSSSILLTITGPPGAKDFIISELGM